MIDPEHNRRTTRYLPGGAYLHHITNPKGEAWSAIYTNDGQELCSCRRKDERRMIREYERKYTE